MAAAGLAALFGLLGLPFLPLTGLHIDASDELACFYPCAPPVFQTNVLGFDIPVMVLSYLGALKAWLYLPLLKLNPGVFLLRIPFLLVGGITVALTFVLLGKMSGRAAAAAGTLLLASDPSFVLATAHDFGPIVFLHFSLLAGILLLLRFERTRSRLCLAAAFFLFGLALWHKALFLWMLAGLAIATLIVFPRRLFALLTPARLAIAACAFAIGAAPLLYFNLMTKGATLRTAEVISDDAPIAQKCLILKNTINGSALFGFLTEERRSKPSPAPGGLLERASIRLNQAAGDPASTWMWHALLASCGLLPWLWFTGARRPAFFVFIYLVVTWAQMAAFPKTGAAAHHAILVWPFPHILVAIAGVQICRSLPRLAAWVSGGVLAVLLTSNGLVLNRYYAQLITNGPAVLFTDAVSTLAHYLPNMTDKEFHIIDWGYSSTLCLLTAGKLPVEDISGLLRQDAEREYVQWLATKPNQVFISYAGDTEHFTGNKRKLDSMAARAGYVKEILVTIPDRMSEPRFEIAQYVKAADPSSSEPAAPTIISASNPDHAHYLSGFHAIEHGAWRWTRREFAVTLGRPASGRGKLTVNLHLPPTLIERLGSITLKASLGEIALPAGSYATPGDHQFVSELPPLPEQPGITVRFVLDKFLPPNKADARELGIIVKSVSLTP
jgi:hypothetical protein